MGGSDLDRYMRDLPAIQAVKAAQRIAFEGGELNFRNVLNVVEPPYGVSHERFAAMVCQASRYSPWKENF